MTRKTEASRAKAAWMKAEEDCEKARTTRAKANAAWARADAKANAAWLEAKAKAKALSFDTELKDL